MAVFNKFLPVICISGPTATGKSKFAIELALKVGGEIINADSVQVYKSFNIGSGKVDEVQMSRVKHHLLSHVDISEQYSAGRFRREALGIISEIHNRRKIPIVVGGTGMYLRALFSRFMGAYGGKSGDDFLGKIEEKMDGLEFQKWGYHLLEIVDIDAASRIEPQDLFRIRRSLSLFFSSGIKSSEYRKIYAEPDANLLGLVLVLEEDSQSLYKKIDERVEQMFEDGWVDEVIGIMRHNPSAPGLKALGYRHISEERKIPNELKGLDIMSLIKNIQRDTRRFAKRQRTWWNNQPNTLGWIPLKSLPKFNRNFGKCSDNLVPNLESCEVIAPSVLESRMDLHRIDNLGQKKNHLLLQQKRKEEEKLFALSFVDGIEVTSEIIKEFLSLDLSNYFKLKKSNSMVEANPERVFYGKIAIK